MWGKECDLQGKRKGGKQECATDFENDRISSGIHLDRTQSISLEVGRGGQKSWVHVSENYECKANTCRLRL